MHSDASPGMKEPTDWCAPRIVHNSKACLDWGKKKVEKHWSIIHYSETWCKLYSKLDLVRTYSWRPGCEISGMQDVLKWQVKCLKVNSYPKSLSMLQFTKWLVYYTTPVLKLKDAMGKWQTSDIRTFQNKMFSRSRFWVSPSNMWTDSFNF